MLSSVHLFRSTLVPNLTNYLSNHGSAAASIQGGLSHFVLIPVHKPNLFFSFIICVGVISRKPVLSPRPWRFTLVFSLEETESPNSHIEVHYLFPGNFCTQCEVMLQLHSSVGGYSVVPTLAGRLFSPLKNDVLEKPGAYKYSGSESSFRRANPELYVWETMSSTWSPGSSRVSSGNTGGRTMHLCVHRVLPRHPEAALRSGPLWFSSEWCSSAGDCFSPWFTLLLTVAFARWHKSRRAFPSCQKGSVDKQCPIAAQLDTSAGPRELCQRTHLSLICP